MGNTHADTVRNGCGPCGRSPAPNPARSCPVHAPDLRALRSILRGGGQPIPQPVRNELEAAGGSSLEDVRVHTGPEAGGAARSLGALAVSVGSDIAFAPGQYAPGTAAGRRLLAHEAAHAAQRAAGPEGEPELLPPGHAAEREADRFASMVEPRGAALPLAQLRHVLRPAQIALAPDPRPAQPVEERGLEIDVVATDLAVNSPFVQAARKATGADLVVMSLPDMVEKLERKVGRKGCVKVLRLWNHGGPYTQVVAGGQVLHPRGGDEYSLPQSGFTLAWLLTPGNQSYVRRLRALFCCGARMEWLGCATAGVYAFGGLRSRQEEASNEKRYVEYGDFYQDEQDAARHGAVLYAADLGRVNMQAWADATGATIVGTTDFTYQGPNQGPTYARVGFQGKQVTVSPTAASCPCDAGTGRVGGPVPQPTELKARIAARDPSIRDPVWNEYLRTLRMYLRSKRISQELAKSSHQDPQFVRPVTDVFRMLIHHLATQVAPPAPLKRLPADEVRPFLKISRDASVEGDAWTQAQLALCDRDNYWRWITFRLVVGDSDLLEGSIRETPEYTRSVILHELEHAADIVRSRDEFERDNGRAPAAPPAAFAPIEMGGLRRFKGTPWGDYAARFVAFHQNRLRPERHSEIAVAQGAQDFSRWSARERIGWIAGVLTVLPPGVGPGKPLAAERPILEYYRSASPIEKEHVVRTFRTVLQNMVDRCDDDPNLGRRALTIRSHFAEIMTKVASGRLGALFDTLIKECP